MSDTNLVVLVALVTAAFGAVLPVGLLLRFRARLGTRWIQNWPSATTFMLSAFPLAVSLFVVTALRARPVLRTFEERALVFGGLGLGLLVALVAALDDFMREDVPPLILNSGEGAVVNAVRQEMELRRMSPGRRAKSARRERYARLVRPFGGLRGLRRRASWLAYALFLQNAAGGAFVALFAWYLVLVKLYRLDTSGDALLTVALLMATWFFFRRYSQWYQFAIYKTPWTKVQPIFTMLVLVGIALVWIIHLLDNPLPRFALIGFAGGLTTLLTVAERLQVKWVTRLISGTAEYLANCRFAHFAVMYALILTLCISLFGRSLPGAARNVATSAGAQQAGQPAAPASPATSTH